VNIGWWGRPDSNRGPESPSLIEFKDFCRVDLQLTEGTSELHARLIKNFLQVVHKGPRDITKADLRQYLKSTKISMAPSTYKNILASLKRFYRDFLGMKDLVESFRFPEQGFKPIKVPTKKDLAIFYQALKGRRDPALFLVFASSGLRHTEVLSLDRFENVNFEKRILTPNKENNESKHTWVSFYNGEAEKALNEYLSSRKDSHSRLFPISKRHVLRIFKRAFEATGIKITPQMLRDWLCCEMGELGVQDRYVDASCGSVPRSILARHYTDYSPEKLKRIYDKANIKVLA
jgi:integrase